MALYLFDGTWNIDDEDPNKDTNVVRFGEVYKSDSKPVYLSGVGTRLGAIGKVLGGLLGVGGRARIEEMADAVKANFDAGDTRIDIVGYSRGAALAVHFANKLAEEGITLKSGQKVDAQVRFLGLFDVVGSFGLSFDNVIDFQDINLGWNFDKVAGNVQHCFHAMALDERRESFRLTRLDPNNRFDHVTETWFRGVHSDIGGGSENVTRSNIALLWMLENARRVGLSIDDKKANNDKYAVFNERAPISENKDVKRDPRRKVMDKDEIHETAKPRPLRVDESISCEVATERYYNWSGVELVEGGVYEFSVTVIDPLKDGDVECGPNGWDSEELTWREPAMKALERFRRCPSANWFELVGSLGDEDDDIFRIGSGGNDYTSTKKAELYLFVNDLKRTYGNNDGRLEVVITRKA